MGKFEEMMQRMGGMSQEEIQQQITHIKKICTEYCRKCPSYTNTDETELGFCVLGKSNKIVIDKGCLCDECPITEEMGLRWKDFCMHGSAQHLAGLNE